MERHPEQILQSDWPFHHLLSSLNFIEAVGTQGVWRRIANWTARRFHQEILHRRNPRRHLYQQRLQIQSIGRN